MIRLTILGGLTAVALTAGSIVVAGPDAGAAPQVNVFRHDTLEQLGFFAAYPTSEVRVFDANPGPGGTTHVKIFSGSSGGELRSFNAFDPQFTGGVRVAAGDIDGDGRDDIITGGGVNGHVKVFSGSDGSAVRDFFAFGQNYNGGVRVGAADLNGDGIDDILTGSTAGAGGHVKVFDGKTMVELASFFPFGEEFSGGVYVAGGSVIVSAGSGIPSQIQIYDALDGATPRTFSPYGGFTGGVFVATNADVPEPQTWLLSGFALLCLWRKRSALRDSVN